MGLNSYDEKEIYISDQEIISLVSAWKSQVGRNPTDDEIVRIINNLVEEEILYREALNLGLDQDDKIIKRRLAQKISFLKQESIVDTPSNNELLDYRVGVFDLNGKLLMMDRCIGESIDIDMREYPSGQYKVFFYRESNKGIDQKIKAP